ncbi:unnamed protein product [Chrysoparadoxa australica]
MALLRGLLLLLLSLYSCLVLSFTPNVSPVRPPSSLGAAATNELALMTWQEVEQYLAQGLDGALSDSAAGIIVPMGATEQHGPLGLIGTDFITAEAVAKGIAQETGALVAPAIHAGMSVHHTSFPGTISLSPSTFIGVVMDHVKSLASAGFSHVLFVNGHGGNVMPAMKAIALLQNSTISFGPGANQTAAPEMAISDAVMGMGVSKLEDAEVKLWSWYSGDEVKALAKRFYEDQIGQHATPDEVAITQHLFPEHIKSAPMDPSAIQVAKKLGGYTQRIVETPSNLSYMSPTSFRERFPDGRMGSSPELASPDDGAMLLGAAIRDGVKLWREFTARDTRAPVSTTSAPSCDSSTTKSGPGGYLAGLEQASKRPAEAASDEQEQAPPRIKAGSRDKWRELEAAGDVKSFSRLARAQTGSAGGRGQGEGRPERDSLGGSVSDVVTAALKGVQEGERTGRGPASLPKQAAEPALMTRNRSELGIEPVLRRDLEQRLEALLSALEALVQGQRDAGLKPGVPASASMESLRASIGTEPALMMRSRPAAAALNKCGARLEPDDSKDLNRSLSGDRTAGTA